MQNRRDRITNAPRICQGKSVTRNLRNPVQAMPKLMRAEMTLDEILADNQDLTREDLLALLAFATRLCQTNLLEP